ncbi:MAG: permease [Candidatus Omnitrophota bacterium]
MMLSRRVTVMTGILYGAFICIAFLAGYEPGQRIGRDFVYFSWDILKVMPPVFILIGLFEVWVSSKAVEKHCGKDSGFAGFLWAILLAGTAVGGVQMAFPVAYALHKKGARLGMIFTYVGAAAICRIPLTTFEASFLGVKFTVIRWAVSLPLVILAAVFLERYLTVQSYKLPLMEMDK